MVLSLRTAITTIVLFVACAALAHGGSLSNGFVTLDDQYLIVENPAITRISQVTLTHIFTSYDPELYIPLTFLSYQLDHAVGGLHPFVFHLQSLFWHTLNALLVAWFLWLLFGNRMIAIILGLLFLLHPLNTEAVAWAAARKDVLSTFFFLSSLISYLWYRRAGSGPGSAYWISVMFFLLGLLSKVSVMTLPIILVFVDWYEGGGLRSSIREKWPYVGLAVVFGIIALFGKSQALVVTTLAQKILMAFKSTWFALSSFFFPTNLAVMYPYDGVISFSPDFLLPALGVLVLAAAVIFSLRWTRVIAFGSAFFLITLAPTFINFAKEHELYLGSDRYSYIPMIGLLCMLGWVVNRLLDDQRMRQTIFVSIAALLLLAAGWGASVQSATWRDSESLNRTVLAWYPHSLAARNNLGMELLKQGKYAEAFVEFDEVIMQKELPGAFINRGLARLRRDDATGAQEDFKRAIALEPRAFEAHYELGNMAYRSGKLTEAVDLYRKALEMNPRYSNALNNLGIIYLQTREWDKAAETFRKLIVVQPLFAQAYYNLAVLGEQRGDTEEAAAMYGKVLKLHPDDADAQQGLLRTHK